MARVRASANGRWDLSGAKCSTMPRRSISYHRFLTPDATTAGGTARSRWLGNGCCDRLSCRVWWMCAGCISSAYLKGLTAASAWHRSTPTILPEQDRLPAANLSSTPLSKTSAAWLSCSLRAKTTPSSAATSSPCRLATPSTAWQLCIPANMPTACFCNPVATTLATTPTPPRG